MKESRGDTHCTGVFAKFPTKNYLGYSNVLLEMSPMENEASQDTGEPFKFLSFVLSAFDKTLDSFFASIGDKSATKRSLLVKLDQCTWAATGIT